MPTCICGSSRQTLRGITHSLEFVTDLLKVTNTILNFPDPAAHQVHDVAARRLTAFSKSYNFGNLIQPQVQHMHPSDEAQPFHVRILVSPVAIWGTFGRRQQADFLVETDGLARHACPVTQLADLKHRCHLHISHSFSHATTSCRWNVKRVF